jgi:uncharacterized membrane protein
MSSSRFTFQGTILNHQRLFISIACGAIFPFLLPADWAVFPRGMMGWDIGASLYLALVWIMMLRSQEDDLRRRAHGEDESRGMILALCTAASLVSLGALPVLLGNNVKLPEAVKTLHFCLGVYTVVCSWFFLQTIFTVHYAHEYYGAASGASGCSTKAAARESRRGGLDFAGDEAFYHYTDFGYFCFTIGMTAQTSDTAVTTARMRRLVLVHSIIAFFFNTGILAVTINLVAGLLSS